MVFIIRNRQSTVSVIKVLLIILICVLMPSHPAAGEIVQNFSAEEWLRRGTVYEEMRNFRTAIREYTKAIKMNPEYAEAYFYRGICYFEIEEYRPAIRDFSKAIRLNPGEATYRFNRGMAYGRCEEHHLAMVDFKHAISLNGKYAAPYFWLGLIQSMYGDVKTGIENMKVSARLGYERAQAYLQSRRIRWNGNP